MERQLDQLGNSVAFHFPVQRIISLVPSQTELLFDLGLGNLVVGVTKFCIHPRSKTKTKTVIGGTKNFNFNKIAQLNPHLIIGNKEENYEQGIHLLQQKYPVWMSNITDWASTEQMILSLGNLFEVADRAHIIVAEINNGFKKVKPFATAKTLYLIWRNPWMAAGKNTFIDAMLSKIGLINSVDVERYPHFSIEEIQQIAPELILLSSEPFPFQKKHAEELQRVLPKSKIVLVNGEMFSWYGSRLLKASDYFSKLNF